MIRRSTHSENVWNRCAEHDLGADKQFFPESPLSQHVLAYTNILEAGMRKNKLDKSVDTIASECIAVRLRMLNRIVTNLYDEALRPLGLKVSQMNILVAAAKMGTARPAEVCERLHLDVSTLSRNVERMKARGWLEVVPDEDGRAQPFRLTDQGRKLLERAVPAWTKAQEKAKSILGEEVVELLGNAMKRVSEA
jgi:DNA-binding MarR family transcriptional regulator